MTLPTITLPKCQCAVNNVTFYDFCCFITLWMTSVFYNEYRNFGDLTKFRCFSTYFSDIKFQRYSGHDFDLSGQVMSSVMWPLYSQYGVSYRWSIRTDRLSCTVFETLRFKRNGVTTLTVWSHVTSCVTWPLDSQCVVSYW